MNLTDLFAGNDTTDGIDSKLDAQKAIERLGHIDRAILYLWVEGYTQAEIAHMFGYSQPRISQILANIYKRGEKVAVDCRNYVDE